MFHRVVLECFPTLGFDPTSCEGLKVPRFLEDPKVKVAYIAVGESLAITMEASSLYIPCTFYRAELSKSGSQLSLCFAGKGALEAYQKLA
jgi:hypothetical protein